MFKVFTIGSVIVWALAGITGQVSAFGDQHMIDSEQALNKENPWLFIQKKIIEEPNNKLMSDGQILLDALIVGGATGAAIHFDYPEAILLLGVLAFIVTNLTAQRFAKWSALKSFLNSYAEPGKDSCKKFTPVELQTFFDALSQMSPVEFDFNYPEVWANVKRAVDGHNPALQKNDNFFKKLKFILITMACIVALRKFYDQKCSMNDRLSDIGFNIWRIQMR